VPAHSVLGGYLDTHSLILPDHAKTLLWDDPASPLGLCERCLRSNVRVGKVLHSTIAFPGN